MLSLLAFKGNASQPPSLLCLEAVLTNNSDLFPSINSNH